jgi:hypothetical protein
VSHLDVLLSTQTDLTAGSCLFSSPIHGVARYVTFLVNKIVPEPF